MLTIYIILYYILYINIPKYSYSRTLDNPDVEYLNLPFVECNDFNRVTAINWYSLNLDGYINGTSIPSLLSYFEVYSNKLTGKLPNTWPAGLILLDVCGNLLSGNLPSFPWVSRTAWKSFYRNAHIKLSN